MSDVKNSSLATDLVSYWELEEASGTRVDSHGSNDLADVNTVASATGIQGEGADFVPSNSERLSRNSVSDLYTSGNWSTSLWFKPGTASAGQCLISYSDSGDSATFLHLFILSSKLYVRRQFASGSLQWVDVTGSTTLSNGTWYHIVVTFDTTDRMRIYLNSSQDGFNSNTTGNPVSLTRKFDIGMRNRPADFFTDGVIDEVGWWHKALSTSEISDLYNSGAGIPYDAGGGGVVNPALLGLGRI